MKRWAVVQDLRPFGYRIEGAFRWRWQAEAKAARSAYWRVLPLEPVLRANALMATDDGFEAELRAYTTRAREVRP